jgi:UDP-2,3-diacylglucosamine pyrophosphatase LpxH
MAMEQITTHDRLRVTGHAKRGTRVVYIAGNHDEFLSGMMDSVLDSLRYIIK